MGAYPSSRGLHNVCNQTLAWLVKVQQILTIKELQIAVFLEADMTKLEKIDLLDEKKLIDFSVGLVVTDDITKAVRLARFTAQEYLNRKDIIHQNSDTTLATAGITYLSFDGFKKSDCTSCNSYSILCDTHYFFEYAVANLRLFKFIRSGIHIRGFWEGFGTPRQGLLLLQCTS
jgi:hypothetical protein